MGQYAAQATDQCLFLNLRNRLLYFGFFGDDTTGSTAVAVNTWYHAAFVYDNTTARRYIYLNGVLDGQSSAVNSLQTTSGPFTIGGGTIGGNTTLNVYYSGYIDHVTLSGRAKSACEVYLDATLACYFTFDSTSSLVDSGPNFLSAVNTGGTSMTGHVSQGLYFSSSLSLVTISGITALVPRYTVFTISMWVYPTSVTGGATLIHCASQSNGLYISCR